MIYRIDIQHFLTHAIDHFTSEELSHFQYAIISAKVKNGRRAMNATKINELYPTPEIVLTYADYQDKDILEKMYMELLHPEKSDNGNDWVTNKLYTVFINTLLHHVDVVILCDKAENDYIDVICKLLKKEFSIEVIDLNELFIKGHVGQLYIDRDEIRDKAVDIRRSSTKEQLRALESTRDGRLQIIRNMSKKSKISKLKELGINITEADKKNLDALLIDEWANDDD